MTKPVVLLWPAPQKRDRIFTPETYARLLERFDVVDYEARPDEADFARRLPSAFAVIGQPDLDTASLQAAASLKVIINVEGNFFPNVDYATAFAHGVRVLGCGTAYAQAVAEYSLALALDAARGITREDRHTRGGSNAIVSATTTDSILLRRATVGLIGYGNLGRSLHALLAPFHNHVRVFDPWLPPSIIEDAGAVPATLDDTLSHSTFVFVFATATAESRHLLDGEKLDSASRRCPTHPGQPRRSRRLRRPAGTAPDEPLPRRHRRVAHRTDPRRQRVPHAAQRHHLRPPRRRHPRSLPLHRRHGLRRPRADGPRPPTGPPPIGSSRAGQPVPQQACGVTPGSIRCRPSSETRRADETFGPSRRFGQVASGQERPEESRGQLANQIVAISLLLVGLVGAVIALLLDRPDVATDGIVPILLGLVLLAAGRLIARRRRS